jgi:hypothetical protein
MGVAKGSFRSTKTSRCKRSRNIGLPMEAWQSASLPGEKRNSSKGLEENVMEDTEHPHDPISDISKQKALEKALAESEERFRIITEFTQD